MKVEGKIFIMGRRNFDGEVSLQLSLYDSSQYDPSQFCVAIKDVNFELNITDEEMIPLHLEALDKFKERSQQEHQNNVRVCDEIKRDLLRLTHASDYISKDDDMP